MRLTMFRNAATQGRMLRISLNDKQRQSSPPMKPYVEVFATSKGCLEKSTSRSRESRANRNNRTGKKRVEIS